MKSSTCQKPKTKKLQLKGSLLGWIKLKTALQLEEKVDVLNMQMKTGKKT
jgi:hypothetical protein